jgi:aspartate kinase
MVTLAVLEQAHKELQYKKTTPILVMKFGGTSVGTVEAMAKATAIVAQERPSWAQLLVVVSALSGVTNLLLESARQAAQGNYYDCPQVRDNLRLKHAAIADALIPAELSRQTIMIEIDELLDSFVNLCNAIGVLGEASPRALDAIASLGERMCARLMAGALNAQGLQAKPIEASRLIITDNHFQDAHPDIAATACQVIAELSPLFDHGTIPVVTGFIGATPGGTITTLGRGGSDYTAGILGAVLLADDVWIWTDVDGIMTADPRAVPDARTIPELTYREIAELAYYGAKVLHPKTIRPVIEVNSGLRICNTFNPSHPGTRLVGKRELSPGQIVRAVTAIRKQRLVTLEGRGMLGVPGVAARAFGSVASTNTSVPLITQSSSEQSICFAVPDAASQCVVKALEKTFAVELEERDIDRIWVSAEVVILTVVGLGMIHTPGVAGKIFTLLGDTGVNVIAIAQGSSEVSISLVVLETDADKALQALHPLTLEGG